MISSHKTFFFVATLIMSTSYLFRSTCARPLGIGILSNALLFGATSKHTRCDVTSRLHSTATSPDDLGSNPLNKKNHLPLFAQIEPKHVIPAVQHDLSKMKTEFLGK